MEKVARFVHWLSISQLMSPLEIRLCMRSSKSLRKRSIDWTVCTGEEVGGIDRPCIARDEVL